MKIKKYTAIFFILIVLLFCCIAAVLKWTYLGHNIIGNLDWRHKKAELKNTGISKIAFYTGGSNSKEVDLKNDEKNDFVNKLVNSQFYQSNWDGMIDTDSDIIIIFKDGSRETVEYCGGSVFQITYKGRMFSIKNRELEQILMNHNLSLK